MNFVKIIKVYFLLCGFFPTVSAAATVFVVDQNKGQELSRPEDRSIPINIFGATPSPFRMFDFAATLEGQYAHVRERKQQGTSSEVNQMLGNNKKLGRKIGSVCSNDAFFAGLQDFDVLRDLFFEYGLLDQPLQDNFNELLQHVSVVVHVLLPHYFATQRGTTNPELLGRYAQQVSEMSENKIGVFLQKSVEHHQRIYENTYNNANVVLFVPHVHYFVQAAAGERDPFEISAEVLAKEVFFDGGTFNLMNTDVGQSEAFIPVLEAQGVKAEQYEFVAYADRYKVPYALSLPISAGQPASERTYLITSNLHAGLCKRLLTSEEPS